MSTDAELLRGASRRDRDSVAALYDRHAGRMYAVALRIAGNPAAASAMVEEVFAAICDGAASFAGEGDAAAWLLRLTRDQALARQTQNVRSPVGVLTLSPRSLVEAAFFDGITVQEAARRLETTEETIRMKLKEGMVALRAELR
jgi:RNA polymerase sigma-70 factor (ECF subfamily)